MKWAVAMLVSVAASGLPGQTFSKLADFSASDGSPKSILQGGDGNFYVLTANILKITPAGVKTTLYTFTTSNPTSLLQARDGNFYGTDGGIEKGTVFEVTPAGSLTRLYTFSGPDGAYPGYLIQGADGALYGTTATGGSSASANYAGAGTVFKVTTTGTFTTLHNFAGVDDGSGPSVLIQGTDGNFYGITVVGGNGPCPIKNASPLDQGCGTIFKMTPAGSLTTLYNFDLTHGDGPTGLIQGLDGNFYGVTDLGGTGTCQPGGLPPGCGTIFQMTPEGS